MSVWTENAALTSLRALLSDGVTDKFEFKVDVFPTPDGITTRFFVGQTRVVEDTLIVYQGGEAMEDEDVSDVDYAKGTFTLDPAPSGVQVQAEFYHQWFTDSELLEALALGGGMVGQEVYTSVPAPYRPATLDFGAYYAYRRKATTTADEVEASAAGYTYAGRSHPNWRALAEMAWEAGKAKLEMAAASPASGVQMAIISYALRRDQPL